MSQDALIDIVNCFFKKPIGVKIEPIGQGLINLSYLIVNLETHEKFVLQKINTQVFKDPSLIEGNLMVLNNYVERFSVDFPFLQFKRNTKGTFFQKDNANNFWRLYVFVPDSITIEKVVTKDQASFTAATFAKFTTALKGLSPQKIVPSIPDFHNLSLRYNQFSESIDHNLANRRSDTEEWISFFKKRAYIVSAYNQIKENKKFPLRIVHADAKIGNVVFNVNTHQPICPIDYDTLMPGYFISDLGDMIRSMTCSVDENETDLERLFFRPDFYEAIVKSYVQSMGLNETEKSWVHFSGLFMIYMQAIRFLTDYLNGDIYYKISYKDHNLDRARNQCKLFELLEVYLASTHSFEPSSIVNSS